MTFADEYARKRRTFVLRFLSKLGGDANESIVHSAVLHGGFGRTSRDELAADLNLLRSRGCTTETWFDGSLRVIRLTDRGEDAAYGRVTVDGVHRSAWDGDGTD